MEGVRLIYVTCNSPDEARSIATDLVERGLAACGNIFPNMQSIYRWEGTIQSETEAVLILKTTSKHLDLCQTRIKEIHSYQTPCILELEVSRANAEYLKWVSDQTLPL